MSEKRPYQFWFSEEEACAIVDALNTLIGVAYPLEESMENGEKYEAEMIESLSKRIAVRMGVY